MVINNTIKRAVRWVFWIMIAVFACVAYTAVHSIYIRQTCPVWSLSQKTCLPCEYFEPIVVDPSIPNHCANRIIREDCCKGFFRSVPKDYVDRDKILDCAYRAQNAFEDCYVPSKTPINFSDIRSVVLGLFLFFSVIFWRFPKTRWFCAGTVSALALIVFFGNAVDYAKSASPHGYIGRWIWLVPLLVFLSPLLILGTRFLFRDMTWKQVKNRFHSWFLLLVSWIVFSGCFLYLFFVV